MPEEMVTDEIATEVDSSDAQSAEEFLFGQAEDDSPADTDGEFPTAGDTEDGATGVVEDQPDNEDTEEQPQGPGNVEEQTGAAEALKVVLSIRESRSTIGVQRPSADPHIESFDGLDLTGLAQEVAAVVERARVRWEDEPRHPAHERPTLPARRQRRRQQEAAQAATEEGETDQQQPETLRLF